MSSTVDDSNRQTHENSKRVLTVDDNELESGVKDETIADTTASECIEEPNSSSVRLVKKPQSRRSMLEDSRHFLEIQESSHYLVGKEDAPSFPYVKAIITCIGLLVGFIMCFVTIEGNRKINQTLAIAIWMATLWIIEVIPLVVTAFMPLFLFPLFGIISSGTVASAYINNTIFLLIAGFLMALTLERWNLHRRFSLKVLTWCGTKPSRLLLGIMGSTFTLSMFVSNTATTLMMVPNAVSICKSLKNSAPAMYRAETRNFAIAVMLGIAYSANIGGMSSLIGTPPNLVFASQLEVLFPDAPEITFATWLGFGLPIGVLIFFITWAYLCLIYLRKMKGTGSVDRSLFKDQYAAMGKWTREQIVVSLFFVLLGLLWLFRADLNFGSFTIYGWVNIFPEPSYISDATIGMLIVFIMFITPGRAEYLAPDDEDEVEASKKDDGDIPEHAPSPETMTTLLDWETANKMPYDIVFLLGGGFALAKGFVESGLSTYLGEQLATLDGKIALPGIVFVVIFLIIWLTELTSNTSTSNIMIPIAASLAVATMSSPFTFMIPATMACSCAFCLPIATPPNMVVFSTGRLPMREMNKAGILLNIICSLILLGAAFSIIPAVTGVAASDFPSWAESAAI